jgi:chaperone required for assembly of F1-ATPase
MSASDNNDNHNDGKISSGGPKQNIKDSLRPPLPKRFYKEAERVPCADGSGFEIRLDGRPVRTPLKRILVIPNEAFADLVLSEWRAQSAVIDLSSMPATRLANSAVDTVADNREAVAAEIVAYAGSDLLCYRASGPATLVARQNEVWDPILQGVEASIAARFIRAEGVMHVDQPALVFERVAAAIAELPDLQLAALQLVTTLTGSAVLAIALAKRMVTADAVWAAAHLDEDWQIEQWGPDEDAEVRRAVHERDFRAAAAALDALN